MYPVSILSCWNRLIKDIHYVINKSVVANAALSSDTRSSTLFSLQTWLALALSTDDTIGIVTFILLKAWHWIDGVMPREHASCLPSHLLYVDAFSPMDLSSSPLGMVYGVMDTAVLWIMGHKPSSLLSCVCFKNKQWCVRWRATKPTAGRGKGSQHNHFHS